MIHTEHKTVTHQYHVCDECKRHNHATVKQCYGCGKDICSGCGTWLEYDPFGGDRFGDYPPLICNGCKESLKDPSIIAAAVRKEMEYRLESIKAGWLSTVKQNA